jgi:hypothetical protein
MPNAGRPCSTDSVSRTAAVWHGKDEVDVVQGAFDPAP